MNNNLYMVLGITGGVILAIVVLAYLKHKGVNVGFALATIKGFFTKAEGYTEAAENLTSGKLKAILESSEVLEKLALQAVYYAEQLMLSLQINDDADGSKRKSAALIYIFTYLKKAGINVDDSVKLIVTGILEKTVLSDKNINSINEQLDKLISEKVTAIQNQLTAATSENQKLKSEVISLTAKLNTVQATVTAVK
jgi:hypothetical protein